MAPSFQSRFLRLTAGLLSVGLSFFFAGCGGGFDSTPKKVTVIRGNSQGSAWELNGGHNAAIHLKFINEAEVRADWLEVEFSFQFGASSTSSTAYVRDNSGGGINYPIKPGTEVEYDFYISDTDANFNGNTFTELSLVRLVTIYFYNYQQDAIRPTDEITYSMNILQN